MVVCERSVTSEQIKDAAILAAVSAAVGWGVRRILDALDRPRREKEEKRHGRIEGVS